METGLSQCRSLRLPACLLFDLGRAGRVANAFDRAREPGATSSPRAHGVQSTAEGHRLPRTMTVFPSQGVARRFGQPRGRLRVGIEMGRIPAEFGSKPQVGELGGERISFYVVEQDVRLAGCAKCVMGRWAHERNQAEQNARDHESGEEPAPRTDEGSAGGRECPEGIEVDFSRTFLTKLADRARGARRVFRLAVVHELITPTGRLRPRR